MATKYTYNEKRKEWYTLVYDGALTPSGEKHRKRISSKKSSKDLERKVAEFKASLEDNTPSTITFGEYADNWLNLYKANKELNTYIMYDHAIKKLEPIRNKRLCDLSRADFQFVINLNSEHPRTCGIINQTFKQIIRSAVLDGYMGENSVIRLTTDICMPKYKKAEKQPLSASERHALLNAPLSEFERAFMSILYYCGLRKGEALALTKDDFDFTNRILTVNKCVVWNINHPILKDHPKSDNGNRSVMLCEPCIRILEPYVANCTYTLFPSQNEPYMTSTTYKNMMASIDRKLSAYEGEKIHLTAHRLRHNFCSLLCYQIPSISTKAIARMLGDEEKMVLEVYSHILEDKEDMQGALERAFDYAMITS